MAIKHLMNYFNKESGMRQQVTAALPELIGKTFLEINSDDGFFCNYAFSHMANRSVGLGNNIDSINRAQNRYPECRFVLGSSLPGEMFDIILYHQRDETLDSTQMQEKIIQVMMHLKPSGKVLWHVSLKDTSGVSYDEITSSFDSYRWRTMSNCTEGEYVFFLQRKQPFVILGKEQAPVLPYYYVESFLYDIFIGREKVDEQLQTYMNANYAPKSTTSIEKKLFENGLWRNLLNAIVDKNKNYSFVLNMHVPNENLISVYQWFSEKGFLMIRDDKDVFFQEKKEYPDKELMII